MKGLAAGIVLDSHGLSEAARGAGPVRSLVRRAKESGIPVVVSAVTLAEVLRGTARDAALHLFLHGLQVAPVTARIGRDAGELLGRTGRKDTVDALVVATAATPAAACGSRDQRSPGHRRPRRRGGRHPRGADLTA